MSWDLMVFDPSTVPADRDGFLVWYDRETETGEDAEREVVEALPPALTAWFLDMIERYPALNGAWATDEPESEKYGDYAIGPSSIYGCFAWSEAGTVDEIALELAEKHGVGLFDASGSETVWRPDASGELDEAFRIGHEAPPEIEPPPRLPMTGRDIGQAAFAIGLIVLGAILVGRWFVPLPTLEEMEPVTGFARFGSESLTGHGRPVFVMVGDRVERFEYVDWFPEYERLLVRLRSTVLSTVWVDRGEGDRIWQIEQNGTLLVEYDEVREAVADNERFDWVFGAVLLAVGIVFGIGILRGRRVRRMPAFG